MVANISTARRASDHLPSGCCHDGLGFATPAPLQKKILAESRPAAVDATTAASVKLSNQYCRSGATIGDPRQNRSVRRWQKPQFACVQGQPTTGLSTRTADASSDTTARGAKLNVSAACLRASVGRSWWCRIRTATCSGPKLKAACWLACLADAKAQWP